MAEINRSYVIDFAVSDFDNACKTFAEILNINGVRMSPEKDSSGQLDGMHFAVGGVNALGVMTAREEFRGPDSTNHLARFLNTHGDGIKLLGHLVDDIDAYANRLTDRGVELAYPTPVAYEDGRLIVTGDLHGISFEFAQHHGDQVTAEWKQHYDENPQRRVKRALRVDVAVNDLDAAIATFTTVLGLDSTERKEFPAGSRSVRGADFAVGGLEAIGLIALDGEPSDAFAAAVADELNNRGEGGLLMAFEVDDLDVVVREVKSKGVSFLFESEPDGGTRSALTESLYGVRLQFIEAQ